MKLGIWTPLQHTIPPLDLLLDAETGRSMVAPEDRDFVGLATKVVTMADRYGFDFTLVAERFMGPDPEAWILAASLAAQTERITLMPAVHPGIVNPQVVAKMAATLDQLSGGRAAINVVNGWWKEEFNLYGNGAWLDDSDARYERMDEFMDVLQQLWSGREVTHQGRFFSLTEARLESLPHPGHQPKVYAASNSEFGRESIARLGDVWFARARPAGGELSLAPDPSPADAEAFDEFAERVLVEVNDMQQRAAVYGRQVECGMSFNVICAETDEAAHRIAASLADYVSGGDRARITQVAGPTIVGGPEAVEQQMRRVADTGIDLVLLKFFPVIDSLRLFGEAVVPALGGVAEVPALAGTQ
jgi:FMNH2-dependent dimethyl sulfone monooxygenase